MTLEELADLAYRNGYDIFVLADGFEWEINLVPFDAEFRTDRPAGWLHTTDCTLSSAIDTVAGNLQ